MSSKQQLSDRFDALLDRYGQRQFTTGAEAIENMVKMWAKHIGKLGLRWFLLGLALSVPIAFVLSLGAWDLYWRYNSARLLTLVSMGATSMVTFTKVNMLPFQFVRDFGEAYSSRLWGIFPASLLAGWVLSGIGTAYWYSYSRKVGMDQETDKLRRGAQLTPKEDIIAQIKADGCEPVTLGGVPFPKTAIQRHIGLLGATGTGKSVAFFEIKDQIDEHFKPRNIVYDQSMDFVKRYYVPGRDVIFNPWDARCTQGWNLFAEITHGHLIEFEQAVSHLIPISSEQKKDNTGSYFKPGSREITQWSMIYLWRSGKPEDRTTAALVQLLFFDNDRLLEALRGTPAWRFVDPDASGSGKGGIDGTLLLELRGLMHMPAGDFSIRKWLHEAPAGANLFLLAPEQYADAMQPIMTMMLNFAITEILSTATKKGGNDLSYMLYADEFGSLGALPAIIQLLTKGRRFGCGIAIGYQAQAQLEQNQGKLGAQIIAGQIQSYLILRTADGEAAKQLAEKLGKAEVDAKSRTQSGGPDSRDGISTTTNDKERFAVMPSQVMKLPTRQGYLKMVGEYDPTEVYLDTPRAVETEQEGFVLRDMLTVTDEAFAKQYRLGQGDEDEGGAPESPAQGKTLPASDSAPADSAAPAEDPPPAPPPAKKADIDFGF